MVQSGIGNVAIQGGSNNHVTTNVTANHSQNDESINQAGAHLDKFLHKSTDSSQNAGGDIATGGSQITHTWTQPFQEVKAQVDQKAGLDDSTKAEIKETVAKIETEIAKEEDASADTVDTLLGKLKDMAPDILEGVADIIINPVHGIAKGIKGAAALMKALL